MTDFKPFKNESDCITVGEDLTIENRVDKVSLYGSIDLTLDREGLRTARDLKAILDQTIAEMERTDLPDKVALEKTQTVKNLFA